MSELIFKIDFTNKSIDKEPHVAFVQSATAAQARSRLLGFIADVKEVRRANAVELGEALATAINGGTNDRLVVLIGEDPAPAAPVATEQTVQVAESPAEPVITEQASVEPAQESGEVEAHRPLQDF